MTGITTRTQARLYTLICVMLWALTPLVARWGQTELDNHQFLFWGSVVSFLAFLLLTISTKRVKWFFTYRLRDWFTAMLLGFLGIYLCYILLYYSYKNSEGIGMLALQYSWPFFIVILSFIFLKEKLFPRQILAICLGFLGLLLILTKGNLTGFNFSGSRTTVSVLVSSFSFSLFSVLSKRTRLETYSLVTIYFLTSALASFVSMLWFSDFVFPGREAAVLVLANGLLVNGLSYFFWIKALEKENAVFIMPIVFLTPVISAVYLMIFFQEPMFPVYVVGLLAVIAGGLLNNIKTEGPGPVKIPEIPLVTVDNPPIPEVHNGNPGSMSATVEGDRG